ncbi:MAG: SIMPL domain-containing protein [Candidatus Paceibacterota bacterium]
MKKKDIKTTYYNANPRYEYGKAICAQYRCDDGQRALVGYEANQSINVVVRDLGNVGKVISSLGSAEVSNIYGPNFRIENEDDFKADVREKAIEKAKEKAKVLAKNLDVRIVGIENFSENASGGIYYAKGAMAMDAAVMNESAPSFEPTLPTGENKIQTSVTITYRVK